MTTTYRASVITRRGGPEVLEVQTLPAPEPRAGEVRVRVRATGVGSTDVMMRRGSYVYAPRVPFVPGYEVVGIVEAMGAGVSELRVGQRVAAITVWGGYGEVVVRGATEFVPVPEACDDAAVVALVLNYVTAWQMIERVAKCAPGQLALVTGANGGVGSALLELLRLRGVRALGAASPSWHDGVRALGATPIPSRTVPLPDAVHAVAPEGVDVAFDVVGGRGTAEAIAATKRGGSVVAYGFMGTSRNGAPSRLLALRTFWSAFVGAWLAGRRGTFYGITARYRRDPRAYRDDLRLLLGLLERGKLQPRIAMRLPLLDARRANELLEAGGIEGKIVLVA
jgi:NADPH:quinone reductase-like Zn-dependent oxidoreductase